MSKYKAMKPTMTKADGACHWATVRFPVFGASPRLINCRKEELVLAFAVRARQIAQQEQLDGQPLDAYWGVTGSFFFWLAYMKGEGGRRRSVLLPGG